MLQESAVVQGRSHFFDDPVQHKPKSTFISPYNDKKWLEIHFGLNNLVFLTKL